jgi:hypothetical protein
MKHIRTDLIDIVVEHGGPANGTPVPLLHGWPDAPAPVLMMINSK